MLGAQCKLKLIKLLSDHHKRMNSKMIKESSFAYTTNRFVG